MAKRTYLDDCFDLLNAEPPTEEMTAVQAEIDRLTLVLTELRLQQQHAVFKKVAKVIHAKGRKCERQDMYRC